MADDQATSRGRRNRFEVSFLYAHSRIPPGALLAEVSVVEDAQDGSASIQTHASGAFALPVGTQAQVMRPVFRILGKMLFMVPPLAVRAGASRVQRTRTRTGWPHESSVWEGVSLGSTDRRLTRSNHRSYAGMSGERIVCSRARGGSLSARRNTGKISGYLEVLVRNLCS
jgi:hypothetical protein